MVKNVDGKIINVVIMIVLISNLQIIMIVQNINLIVQLHLWEYVFNN
jgi:hypothetical protein